MQIFEIFNCVDGSTQGYRTSEARAKETCERVPAHILNGTAVYLDYLPAKDGFYVVDMRDNVKAGPFADGWEANRNADFENMASDFNSFRVVDWRN